MAYSSAPQAAAKKKIDQDITDAGGTVDLYSEAYLKDLISRGSQGKTTVGTKAKGLQFFIVKGGAEGFLGASYAGVDASRVSSGGGVTTSGRPGTLMVFDYNDLIAVFDAKGKLISSALLIRPLSITNPNIWTERTANKVYDAWNGRSVSIYRNTQFDIKYYGLVVDDSLGWYKSGSVRVDIHKQEATNGCIFIVDSTTPAYTAANHAILNAFEPKLIKDVQAAIGANVKWNIGTMHMVEIK